jgi:hypothetical protein
MTAFTFYFPSNGDHDDHDEFMQQIWNERILDYLIYVRRVSLRGNPYIKGLFVVNDDSVLPPLPFEVNPISHDCVSHLLQNFKEEQRIENNAVEYSI